MLVINDLFFVQNQIGSTASIGVGPLATKGEVTVIYPSSSGVGFIEFALI